MLIRAADHADRRGRFSRRAADYADDAEILRKAAILSRAWRMSHIAFVGAVVRWPEEARSMVKVALLVRLEAKAGKEAEVEQFLRSGLAIVQEEPATVDWFAIRDWPLHVRHLRHVP